MVVTGLYMSCNLKCIFEFMVYEDVRCNYGGVGIFGWMVIGVLLSYHVELGAWIGYGSWMTLWSLFGMEHRPCEFGLHSFVIWNWDVNVVIFVFEIEIWMM